MRGSVLARSAVLLPLLSGLVVLEGVGQNLPIGFANDVVSTGWNQNPQGMVWDGNGRMYVWEKAGLIWIVDTDGTRLPIPLLDIQEEVGNWRDHGMLGFALDPNFLSNGYFYVFYTVDRHHLLHFGTPAYDPLANEYFDATIMRLTRFTASLPDLNTVVPGSRSVLLGQDIAGSPAVTHETHSTGSLVFGTDGTLLVSLGDGAGFIGTDVGSSNTTFYTQALADGIIRPQENVGALRAQMLNSMNGKVLRLDPATGNGIPSNPFYDAGDPSAARSRVWALGFRNPFRMTLRPGSGSLDPMAGDPGTLYIGDVGWNLWEELNVCTEGGMNFGWPLYEGLEAQPAYMQSLVPNQDAPTLFYDGITCTQQYYYFQDLLKQDTPIHLNGHPDVCDPSVQIPGNIPHFFHSRPMVDWIHGNRSRTGIFNGPVAATIDLNHPASPVPGPSFGGFASLGGTWFSGTGWPAEYQNTYFHADYAGQWIKRFEFDQQDDPESVHDFADGLGTIVYLNEGPDGCLYYVRYANGSIHRICSTISVNLPPVAVASQSVQYGPGPLSVDLVGSSSYDPEGLPLGYFWDLGDGTTSTQDELTHVFTAQPGVPTSYTVTLTVTDDQGQTAQTQLLVSVNNTPPAVAIISFPDGHFYPVGVDTVYSMEADVTDAEHGPAQLSYAWRTILHHNTHTHPEPIDPAMVTSTVISGVGCDGQQYSYVIELTVTDAGGLSTTVSHTIFPACHLIPPTAIIQSDVSYGTDPLLVEFSGSASYDPGQIVSYAWDFGDGTGSVLPEPTHVYTGVGQYFVTLSVADDDGLSAQATRTITVIDQAPPQCSGPAGTVLREYWLGVAGGSINDLLNSPDYPDNPSGTSYPTSFAGPQNFANNYGTRMRGFIVPPVTGTYYFVATSDDGSVVYLSPNADPEYRSLICSVPGYTGPTELNKYASQRSLAMQLEAGVHYYVEMLQKEASGGDHLALWWETPHDPQAAIIPDSVLVAWEDCGPHVSVRAFLGGCINIGTNLMSDALRTAGYIPLDEPYTGLGFAQVGSGGEVVDPTLLTLFGSNAIVDWVLIELRHENDPSIVVATKAALIRRNGTVVDVNGFDDLLFAVPPGNYYLAIRHRNHLGVMTLNPVILNGEDVLVDFTTGSTQVYGTASMRILPNGRRAMWAGNAFVDDVLKYAGPNNDRDRILSTVGGSIPTAVVFGYSTSDANMDGLVKYAGVNNDRDRILQNIGGGYPTSLRVEQLP